MNGEVSQADVKKLVREMEKNALLNFELEGYMKDSQRREIFREHAKHRIKQKKKYTYIDYGVEHNQSGKFMIQKKADKVAPAGYVWGIKAYGQKGYPEGTIQDVTKQYKENNKNFTDMVMKRALKNRLKRGY